MDDELRRLADLWNGLAPWYSRAYSDAWSLFENEQIRDFISSSHDLTGTVLDLGCGQGLAADLLADLEPGAIVGVDVAMEMLRYASTRGRAIYVCADMRKLPFRDASFDCALSLFGSPSYVPDISLVLDEISRVLKPGCPYMIMLLSRWSLRRLGRLKFRRSGLYSSLDAPIDSGVPVVFYDRRIRRKLQSRGLLVDCVIGQSSWRSRSRLGLKSWTLASILGRMAPELGHSLILTGHKVPRK